MLQLSRKALNPIRLLFVWLALFAPICAFGEPIGLHPKNNHYFLWRGQPTILVTSGEHYGAVLNLDFDFERYLQTLAADGLNHTRTFSGTYREVPGSFGIPTTRFPRCPDDSPVRGPSVRRLVRSTAGTSSI